jgi:hypothetical protein
MAQKDTWMPLMLNQETSFSGVSKTSYIKPYSPKTSEKIGAQVLNRNSNIVSVNEVNGLQNIRIYFAPQTSTKTIVSAVAAASVFAWIGASDIETYTPPISTYQTESHLSKKIVQFTHSLSKISTNLTWLTDFYKTALNASTAQEIYPLISGIAKLFEEKDYSTVNTIIAQAQLDVMSPTAMTTLVRTTYPARKKLANWDSKVIDVKEKLDILGMDTKKVLRGLI